MSLLKKTESTIRVYKRVFGIPVFLLIKGVDRKEYRLFGVSLYKKKLSRQWEKIYILGCQVKRILRTSPHDSKIQEKLAKLSEQLEKQCVLLNLLNEQSALMKETKAQCDILNKKLSNMKCIIEAQTLHPRTFGKYKNAFVGKDVVLVCSGPSAKYYKPIKNALHVGVNGAIYLKNVLLDFLFVQDYAVKQQHNASLNIDALNYVGNNCKKFWGIMPDDRLVQTKQWLIERIPISYSYAPNTEQYLLEDIFQHNIATDLSREPLGDLGGTTFSALQFILYTNPKRLYLVGWDCSTGYAHNESVASVSAKYQVGILKKFFLPFIGINYPNIEIISINPVGLKGMFKDIYTEK